jgi:Mg2+-importing ATPase
MLGLLSSAYLKEEIKSGSNPFDFAIFQKVSSDLRQTIKNYKSVKEISFDPFRRRNSVLAEDSRGQRILIAKGAPETIINISRFGEDFQKEKLLAEIKKTGKLGKRVLAVAYKDFDRPDFSVDDEKDMVFSGYFIFSDPLKKTAKEAINLAGRMGLRIKILTGDSIEVAGVVAKEVGLIDDPSLTISGEKLESLSKEEFVKAVEEFSVFARVSPKTKYDIIEALQKKFEVGFLGEGINDAPALKLANVAAVVRESADISRDLADIILLEKDLRVIIDGIREGKNMFANINKYVKCALASNFGNFYSIALISLMIPFLPMLPVQILLGNLLSDFPLIMVTTDAVDIEELRNPKFYQLNRVLLLVIFLALISTIFDFIFFGIFYKIDPALLRTLWFIESILTEILLIFSIRTSHFFLKTKAPSRPLLAFAALATIVVVWLPFSTVGQNFFHFVAPPSGPLLAVGGLIFVYFWTSEIVKLLYFRYWKINGRELVKQS